MCELRGPYTDMIDESKITLGEMIHNDGREFMYVYHYGDQWRHVLTVENILDRESGVDYPVWFALGVSAPARRKTAEGSADTAKLTCRYGAQRNSGQVQRLVRCHYSIPYFFISSSSLSRS